MSERDYLIAKGIPKGLAKAPFAVRASDREAANQLGFRRRLMHQQGRQTAKDIARGESKEFTDADIDQMKWLRRNSRREFATYQEKGPGFLMPAAKPKPRRVLP